MNNATWDDWIKQYKNELNHPAGFEQHFVETILKYIPIIEPNDVIPQFHFTDNTGKDRYIDFMIQNAEKGFLLPIELDGYQKFEFSKGPDRFYDFLSRQNAMIQRFGMTLRFSNYQMFNHRQVVINEIVQTLKQQQQHHQQQEKQQTENHQKTHLIEHYQQIISELKNEIHDLNESNTRYSSEGIQHIETAIQALQQEVQKLNNTKIAHSSGKSTPKKMTLLTICALIMIGGVALKEKVLNHATTVSATTSRQEQSKSPDAQYLNMSEALHYIGEYRTVCGKIVEISPFKQGHYLNMGKKFPLQLFTAVIWDNQHTQSLNLASMENNTYCFYGMIELHNKVPRININSPKQLSPFTAR